MFLSFENYLDFNNEPLFITQKSEIGEKSNVSMGKYFGFGSGNFVLLQLKGGWRSCVGPATAVKFNFGNDSFDAILASKAPYLKVIKNKH